MAVDWKKYYEITSTRNIHPLLEVALYFLPSTGVAYDLGAGAGVETAHLLNEGWKVIAVDKEPASINFIKARCVNEERLDAVNCSFEDLRVRSCDFVFASASFPFCHPISFDSFWKKLSTSLTESGIIAGTFFGHKDEWSSNKDMTFMNEDSVLKLFEGFEVLYFDEVEEDKETALGKMKHWHIYSFVISKTSKEI